MVAIIVKPDLQGKLDILAGGAKYDVCMASCNSNGNARGRIPDPEDPKHRWVYPAALPGGGQAPILKVLQTNRCVNKCTYCSFSAAKDDVRRVDIEPDELALAFMTMYRQRLVEGIFLTSGVCKLKSTTAMEKMVRTAEILRKRYRFKGYIHLKILPATPFELVERSTQLATRLSVNLEAPSSSHLNGIAPDKTFATDLVHRMQWAGSLISRGAKTASQTTQFVVGAGDESDSDILRTVDWTYREAHVFRAYYSSYQREKYHKAEELMRSGRDKRASLLREHRLYQGDYLLRGYGFRLPDMVFDDTGRLPERVDPKTAYAMMHPEIFPIDINKADEEQLLLVPGIGPMGARRIVEWRVKNPFHNVEELRATGAYAKRAAAYVEFSGKGVSQLHLFEQQPPKGWKSGERPVREVKDIGIGSEPEPAKVKGQYEYPGQKGKPLYYNTGGPPITCR